MGEKGSGDRRGRVLRGTRSVTDEGMLLMEGWKVDRSRRMSKWIRALLVAPGEGEEGGEGGKKLD